MKRLLFIVIVAIFVVSCSREHVLPGMENEGAQASAGLSLDADSLRIELPDTAHVAVGGDGDFTVRVMNEDIALAWAEGGGRSIAVAARSCGLTTLRVSAPERPGELVLTVRVVERRTPWPFDDALADASVRFEAPDICLYYDDGGVIAERSMSEQGALTYRLIRPDDGRRISFAYQPTAAAAPCRLDSAVLTVDGVPHPLSSAVIEASSAGARWFNLTSASTGRRMVLVMRP